MDQSQQDLVEKVLSTSTDFCAALTRDEVEKFVAFSRHKMVVANEVLYDVGSISDEFFLIVGGEALLLRDIGEEVEVGRLGAGRLTGHMSFFDRLPRDVRLRAGDNGVEMLGITRTMYKRLCIEHPYISVNLLEFVVLSLDNLLRSTSSEVSSLYHQLHESG